MSVDRIYDSAKDIADALTDIVELTRIDPFPRIPQNMPSRTGCMMIKSVGSSDTGRGRQEVMWELIIKLDDILSGSGRKTQRYLSELMEEDVDTSIIGKLKRSGLKTIPRVFELNVEYLQGDTDRMYVMLMGSIIAQV